MKLLNKPQKKGKNMKKNKGFTLVELMITVLIVGIISSFAIPNYRDYVIRAEISEALAGLSSTKLKMEQFFQDNRTYEGACDSGSPAHPPSMKNFTISCDNTASSYTLTATGLGFTFTVDPQNNRSTTSAKSGWKTNDSCWIINRLGECQN